MKGRISWGAMSRKLRRTAHVSTNSDDGQRRSPPNGHGGLSRLAAALRTVGKQHGIEPSDRGDAADSKPEDECERLATKAWREFKG